jgi:4-hydroxy-tetrahydrodipicolinate synthase
MTLVIHSVRNGARPLAAGQVETIGTDMKKPKLPQPLRGIVTPLVTPLSDRDALDDEGLKNLIEHVLAGGVSALFVLGTTGEGPSLSYMLRYQVVERVCELVAGRVAVLVGVSDTSLAESLELAEWAYDSGASAVVAAPPYYYRVGQADLQRHFKLLAAESPLPVFLYNMPECCKVEIGLETLRACGEAPNIVGLKDSSGDLAYFGEALRLRSARPDWSFFTGPEHLLAESVSMGADGGVCGGANLHPRLFVDLYDAAAIGDLAQIEELQRQVVALGRLYEVGGQFASVIQGLKCALSLLGICDDVLAEPLARLDERARGEIAARMQSLGLSPARASAV